MPRVREITLDNLKFKIAPFSFDEAEQYIKESKEMLAREPKATTEEWSARTLNSVVLALNKAAALGGNGTAQWDAKKLTAEYDMLTIQELYEEFMRMSGLALRPGETRPGEAAAISAAASS